MSKISREALLEMVIKAGFKTNDEGYYYQLSHEELACDFEAITRFAELVASKERQACAKICEEESDEWWFADAGYQGARNCKEKIILRGEE